VPQPVCGLRWLVDGNGDCPFAVISVAFYLDLCRLLRTPPTLHQVVASTARPCVESEVLRAHDFAASNLTLVRSRFYLRAETKTADDGESVVSLGRAMRGPPLDVVLKITDIKVGSKHPTPHSISACGTLKLRRGLRFVPTCVWQVEFRGQMRMPRAVNLLFPLPFEDSNDLPMRAKIVRYAAGEGLLVAGCVVCSATAVHL
jgi:hypothetical protein